MIKKCLFLILFLPSVGFADNVFTEPEEEDLEMPEDHDPSFINSVFGTESKPKPKRWQKFKSLEEYGGAYQDTPTQVIDPLKEQEVKKQYLKAKDPFSNSDRFEEVESTLNPPKQE